jgi:hypothetical protein
MSDEVISYAVGEDGVRPPFAMGDAAWEEYPHGERSGMRFRQLGEYGVCSPGGDVVITAGQQAGHTPVNETDEPVRYLIIGERNPSEVTVHTDAGRAGVRLTGVGHRGDETVDYRDGE